MTTEGLAQAYYEKILSGERTAFWMSRFFCEIFNYKPAEESALIGSLGNLVKNFGAKLVFDSILDMSNMTIDNMEKFYPLLLTLCRRNFDRKYVASTSQSLSPLIKEMREKVRKAKNRKVRINGRESI